MRRVLFGDRDGTLVAERKSLAEPVEQPLVAGVIPALLRFKAAGYQFVIVTNQPGLGAADNPRPAFEQADQKLLALLASQGIRFLGNFVCPHLPEAHCACRKPAIGLVRDFVNAEPLDRIANGIGRYVDTAGRPDLFLHFVEEEPVGTSDFKKVCVRPSRSQGFQRRQPIDEIQSKAFFLSDII